MHVKTPTQWLLLQSHRLNRVLYGVTDLTKQEVKAHQEEVIKADPLCADASMIKS